MTAKEAEALRLAQAALVRGVSTEDNRYCLVVFVLHGDERVTQELFSNVNHATLATQLRYLADALDSGTGVTPAEGDPS